MPSIERSSSRESDGSLRHQHSASSDIGRAMVPMWDSSDPERAPPPLPMNPSSPVVTSRPNTSSAIQSAHAALTEKARESAYTSNNISKRPELSPERSLIKGATHKRMQSLQGGTVRDLSNLLEGGSTFGSPLRSPEKITRRPSTPHANKEFVLERAPSPEKEQKDQSRATTPTPAPKSDMPTLRPSLRKPERHQSILGENTPPQSATMLALQNMATRDSDTSLSTVTNGSSALARTPQTFDAISNQILSLTSIATNLQREMTNLTRRSKDNATDLVSLKEATNARDEDIRKSLRELVINLSEESSRASSHYLPSTGAGLYLDSKAHNSPNSSRAIKQFSLPRIPSPNSFASSLDRESMSTPDGAISIALLEKILREMGTKEGQDQLVNRLSEVADRLARDGLSTAKKLEDLVEFIKINTETNALVAQNGGGGVGAIRSRSFSFDDPPRLELDFENSRGASTQRSEALLAVGANKENQKSSGTRRSNDVLNDDILKIIRSVKDSVAQGGGLTAEVKALVRELRGEVLGMGREIGRKLDEASAKDTTNDSSADKEHVARIVQDGLEELRQHMDGVLREHRRQSNSSAVSRSAVDYQEVYNAVRAAVNEKPQTAQQPALEKDDIIEAVREAWENYKPDIELQHFGLEREELLATLKEGIQEYASQDSHQDGGATREEVFTAVVEGLKHFSPPKVETEASLSRDEILDAVRECLEEFEFPSAPSAPIREDDMTRDIVQDAVRQCLEEFEFPAAPSAPPGPGEAVTRELMLDAINEGLHNFEFPASAQEGNITKDVILDAVDEVLHNFEFPAPSQDSGISKDAVLEAVNEGLRNFDFAAANSTAVVARDVSSSAGLTRDDVFDTLEEVLHNFEFPTAPQEPGITKDSVLEAIQEGLHNFDFAAANSSAVVARDIGAGGLTRDDVFDTVEEVLSKFEFPTAPQENGITKDSVLEAVHEGLRNFDFASANSTAVVARDIGIGGEGLTRSDVFETVDEVLHKFEFPAPPPAQDTGITKDAVLEAIHEGLHNFDFAAATSTALVARDVTTGLTRDDVFDTVDEVLHKFEFPVPVHDGITKDAVFDAVNECLQNFDFGEINSSAVVARDVGENLTRDDVFDAVKAVLENQPAGMSGSVDQQVLERLNDIVESMRNEFQSVSEEAKQNVAAHGRDTEQLLDATKDGFERLRGDIETYVDRAADVTGKDEILDSMRESFEILLSEVETMISKGSNNSLESIQSELEHLRGTMATSLVQAGGSMDKDEIIEALREGLDGLRAEIDRPRDSNESVHSGTGEIMDALQDGLSELRAEVEKLGNKPVDLTVNYEILDTLKAGLEGVRADIDRLRETGTNNEQAVAAITDGAVVTAEESLKRNDIENLEVLITQLRIKVEALESMPPPPPQVVPGTLAKEDLAEVEEMLRNVQETVNAISSAEKPVDEDGVKREDVEALETLLRNTKAKIDDMDPEQLVKREHLDIVEGVVRETSDNINEFASTMMDVSKKEDVNVIELLVRDVVAGLEEMKERAVKESEDLEKVTKTDVEAVEAVCLDVKSAIEQMVLADLAALASKDDVTNLSEMVKEFKDRIETHAETNAKSFEERQAETVGVGERVNEIREFLDEFKDAMKEKLDEGTTSFEALGKVLETHGETITKNATVSDDVKEVFETLKAEFEKSHAGVVGAKLESDEKFQLTWDKFDNKIDEKFNEIISKYDDAQITAEARAKILEDKTTENGATLLETKTVGEDVRLVIDTLNTTLTDSVEKMDESGKTVFNRVDETFTRVDEAFNRVDETFNRADETFKRVDETFTRVEETHADAKAEHQLTREQVFKAIGAIEEVQSSVTDYNPKILDSLKDVLMIVGQHYEHSKTSTTTIQEKIAEIPPPPPPIELPLLQDVPAPEKYDDGQVHEKLDKLVDHMDTAGKSFAQLDMLDKIHQQVMQTAAEVSEFVSAQTQRIANDHEDKEKAVEAATIALEKRLAQKDHVEATVVGLREEEEQLKQSVAMLKAEQDNLAHQKMRLSADVSSFETALRIRREELHAMEARAEGLERRILEGVMDHSRALLMSKSKPKSNKARDVMSRKRVPSQALSGTESGVSIPSSRASNATQSAVNMAMNGNRALLHVPVNTAGAGAGTSRRILSLSQINNNVPTGGINRSHSVKTPAGAAKFRKSSWAGSMERKYGELNKENLALKESEEEENASLDGDLGGENDEEGDDDTMRRSSFGTTILTTTGTGLSVSVIDEGTEWTGSEVSSSLLDSDAETETDIGTNVGNDAGRDIILYDNDISVELA
ncbi:chromosome segregation ATPase [Phlyctema vagabunda]|uniref:Chromosome segregation ATPase n=1 Tax=Phlyctema vagabunda TaxID=108571 RepID=A0ABR4PXX6_9HELO